MSSLPVATPSRHIPFAAPRAEKFATTFAKVSRKRSAFNTLPLICVVVAAGCATPQRPPTVGVKAPLPVLAPVVAPATLPTPTLPPLTNQSPIGVGVNPPSPAATSATSPPDTPQPATSTVATPVPATALDAKAALLQAWVNQQQRLYQVAAPLLLKNTDLCPAQSRRILGFTAKNRFSYSNDFADVARQVLGLDDQLQITSVLPGSGAMLAGIKPGDILLAAGGKNLPTGPNAERASSSIIAESIQGNAPIELTVLNGSDTTIVEVVLTRACAVAIDLGNSDDVNSHADGRRVMVTRGMLGFVRSDEELAYVLAREIAANIISPTPRPAVSTVIDRLHTLSINTAPTPDEAPIPSTTSPTDASVEKLALYMLARAGYGIDGVAAFWERLNAAFPADIRNSHAATHSLLSERLNVIAQTTQAIKNKQKSGVPLRP
ncbi:MAG: PDZ domain-containing protein [Pseudomonadota bacterium]